MVSFLGSLVAGLGCKVDTRVGDGLTYGPSSDSSPSTSTTGPAGTASTSTGSSSSSESSTGDAFKFDMGGIPDAGPGPQLPTIPTTCLEAEQVQSTVGCVFRGAKMLNYMEEPSSVVVGNVSETETATINVYVKPVGGEEQLVDGPVEVAPGETFSHRIETPAGSLPLQSYLRRGETFKVVSDLPVVAYQHSPTAAEASNDSSMLLPDHAQGRHYIAATYTETGDGPPYVNIIGLKDGTTVTWAPLSATGEGDGVPGVVGGMVGQVEIDDYDLLQIVTETDLSGAIFESSEPVWMVGAMLCADVPTDIYYCDHLEEQLLPLEYWGQEYVGAHAPTRGDERYHWRVFSAADGTTITTDPPQPMTPITLDRGRWIEFSTQESFVITADGPIMPVQYLEGQEGGAGIGDPAAYQMVPTEQFLPRYVFVTGVGYDQNYVQVTRPMGAPDVFVDDVLVEGYEQVGEYEVADWMIEEGSHVAYSDGDFGVTQVGYTEVTSYAYPGGLSLKKINPNPEG